MKGVTKDTDDLEHIENKFANRRTIGNLTEVGCKAENKDIGAKETGSREVNGKSSEKG